MWCSCSVQLSSALELSDGVLTTQHAVRKHSLVSGEKGNKRMRAQNRRSDEMKERRETTEGEERNDFGWREGNKKKSAKVAERRAKSGEQRERRRSGRKKERRKEGKEQKQRH